jgi:hypothetical protein
MRRIPFSLERNLSGRDGPVNGAVLCVIPRNPKREPRIGDIIAKSSFLQFGQIRPHAPNDSSGAISPGRMSVNSFPPGSRGAESSAGSELVRPSSENNPTMFIWNFPRGHCRARKRLSRESVAGRRKKLFAISLDVLV